MEKTKILRELTKGVNMPSFCDEEGRCGVLDDCTAIDASECSCCNINRIVKAFNKGVEFQKQKSPWISVEDDLPYKHQELLNAKYVTKEVFLLKIGGFVDADYMLNIDGKWEWFTNKSSIKYLMPIPEPPK